MAETDQGQSSSKSGSTEQSGSAAHRGAAGAAPAGTGASGAAGGLVDEAKDVASRLGASAKELTSEVARSAQDLVKGEVGKRTEKGAEDLSQVAHALRRSGRDLEDNLAAPYVERVADQIERASDYLRTTEPGQMLTSVQNFARREPALFLGGAFALGFLGARFLKSSARSDEEMDLGNGGGSDWGAGTSANRAYSSSASGSGMGGASSGASRPGQSSSYGGSSYGAGRTASYGGSSANQSSASSGSYGSGSPGASAGSPGASTPGARGV